MGSNPSEPKPQKPGGLLARLFGMGRPAKAGDQPATAPQDQGEEVLVPVQAAPPPEPVPAAPVTPVADGSATPAPPPLPAAEPAEQVLTLELDTSTEAPASTPPMAVPAEPAPLAAIPAEPAPPAENLA